MPALTARFASLPGFEPTYAAWPVWGDSTPKPVQFEKLSRKEAANRYQMAREFDRATKKGNGCQGGALGTPALKVLEALKSDFLNYATGQLDPAYKAIARAANISESAVYTALKRLWDLGILRWHRRCDEGWSSGRYWRRQRTNAYSIRPPSEWKGFAPPPKAPPPMRGTWGDPAYMPEIIDAAALAGKQSGPREQLRVLRLAAYGSPKDDSVGLALALARLGERVAASGKK